MTTPKYLMCQPDFFGVDYVINPWMAGHVGQVDRATAKDQWNELYRVLLEEFEADVKLVAPKEGLPDMVFTANAGIVKEFTFVPARFKYQERKGEEPFFERWFEDQGYSIQVLPHFNEGAGDVLTLGDTTFAGYGPRTEIEFHFELESRFGLNVQSLELVDPRFYHVDTCFCPLPDEGLLWFPPAFSEDSVRRVHELVDPAFRYAVSVDDAISFACNAVASQGHIVLNDCSDECTAWLEQRGLEVHQTPLTEFMLAGGSAKCLTLLLSG